MELDQPPSPTFHTKHHHPYFTPSEVDTLSTKQRGKLSTNQEERQRQQACAFIEAIGGRIGFPRKTIATAQHLYHRFHLYFPRKDFSYYDVTLAALYVSTKMQDTLKKPQDILMVSYAVRFPDLAAKSKAIGGDLSMDPEKVEQDRQRLLAIERLILETVCFNFTSKMPFPYVVKIGRGVGANKHLTSLAWRLATDSNRTMAPLLYPPHSIALASVYLAALLLSFETVTSLKDSSSGCKTSSEIVELLGKSGNWEARFHSRLEDVQEIAHTVMDLLLHESTTSAFQSSSTQTSPSTPQSPSPYAHPPLTSATPPALAAPSIPHRPDQLTRLKILMRENDVPRERKTNMVGPGPSPREVGGGGAVGEAVGLGRNEGTVRFLFGPPWSMLAT